MGRLDRMLKEREKSREKSALSSSSQRQTRLRDRLAEREFANFQSAYTSGYEALQGAYGGWNNEEAMNSYRNTLTEANKAMSDYINTYSPSKEITDAYDNFAKALGNFDNRANLYSNYINADAFNKAKKNAELTEKYKGASYDKIQRALSTAKDEDEKAYLKSYTDYSSLEDFDKAMHNTRDMDFFESLEGKRSNFAMMNAFDEYKGLMKNADFKDNINKDAILGAEDEVFMQSLQGGKISPLAKSIADRGITSDNYGTVPFNLLSPEMQDVGAYIYNKQGEEAYKNFMRKIAIQASAELNKEQTEEYRDFSTKNPLTGTVATLANAITSPASAFGAGLEQVASIAKGIDYNPFQGMSGAQRMFNESQSAISQEIEDWGGEIPKVAYDALSVGAVSRLGQRMFGPMYNVIMGTGSFAQTYGDALLSGMSPQKSAEKAMVAGTVESATEAFGMDWAFNKEGKTAIRTVLNQFLAEGTEEFVGSLANLIYDMNRNGSEAEFRQNVQKYVDAGYSQQEATRKAIIDFSKDVAEQFVTAGLSAGFEGGIHEAITAQAGKTIDATAFNEAMKGFEGGDVYADYLNMLDAEGNLTNWQRGSLYNRALNEASEEYKSARKDLKKEISSGNYEVEDIVNRGEKAIDNYNKVFATQKGKLAKDIKVGEKTADAEGNDVKINDVVSEDGKTKVVTDNGTIEASAMTADEDTAYVMNKALKIKDEAVRQAYIAGYQGGNSVQYDANVELIVDDATRKLGMDTMLKQIDTNVISQSKAIDLYKAVQKSNAEVVIARRAKNDALIAKWNKQYKAGNFDVSEVNTEKLDSTKKRLVQFLNIFSKMGMNIKVIDDASRLSENGSTQGRNLVINLSARYGLEESTAEGGKYVVPTFAHESTHWMENILGEEFGTFKNLVRDYMGESKWNNFIALEQKNAKNKLSDADAESEVIARFCEDMLNDTSVADRLFATANESTIKKLINAIKKWFAQIRADIQKLMEGYESQSPEAQFARAMGEEFKKVQDAWVEMFERALAVNQVRETQTQKLDDAGIKILDDGIAYNRKTLEESWLGAKDENEVKEVGAILAEKLDVSQEKGEQFVKDLHTIASIEANNKYLDYFDTGLSSWVKNKEYGANFDFSYLCPKRLVYTCTLNAIRDKLKKPMTTTQFLAVRKFLVKNGHEAPCSFCYVEGQRRNMDEIIQREFLDKPENKKYGLSVAQLTDANFLEDLRQEWITTGKDNGYASFEKAMNRLGQAKPKALEKRRAYRGEIVNTNIFNADAVKRFNRNMGLRFFAYSDFEVPHTLDLMQVITDMSVKKLAGFAYTKQPKFVEIFGGTGLKIDMSCVAKGVDKNGKIIFDDTEGMNSKDALRLRNKYSRDVGIVCVVFSDEQLKSALADDRIDYVLPFHASGWKKDLWSFMGLPADTKDFTKEQSEKAGDENSKRTLHNIAVNDYWDYSLSGRENAQRYLDIINERGMTPLFRSVLEKKDGKWILPEGKIGDGYFKLLIEQKMYDNDGNSAKQMPVMPNFDMEKALEITSSYDTDTEAFPVANDVVKDFMEWHDNGEKLFSRKVDSEGNELSEAQAEFFKDSKAVDADGDLQKVYHGTVREFYTFDRQFANVEGDWGKGFYFTNDINDVEENYANTEGADLTSKIETEADRLEYTDGYEDKDHDEIVEELRKKYITAEEPITLECYLNIKNPCYMNTWLFDDVASEISEEDYEDEDEYYEAQSEATDELVEAVMDDLRSEFDDYDTIDAYGQKIAQVMYDAVYEGGIRASDLKDRLNELYLESEEGLAGNEIARLIIKSLGYDGIIDTTVSKKFTRMGLNEDSTHYIVFESNQAKLTSNLNPTENDDIRYSNKVDSEGHTLTEGQANFFKDSKVVDVNGNLKVMYHVSPNEFTVFDKKKAKGSGSYGSGFYFSDAEMKYYGGKTYAVYLNIKNPISSVHDAKTFTDEQIKKFVQAVADNEDYGLDNYGYDATVSKVVNQMKGRSDYAIMQDINGACIGNFVEAVKLFNEVNGTDFDGIEVPSEVVAFYPEQIKNIDNKKPTENPDIRYSKKVDSDGNKLTEEQERFFADSKVRDAEGNLLVMYHGTDSYKDFTVFKAGQNGYLGKGMYFTEKDYIAKKYAEQNGYEGRIYKVYLNLTNPLIVTTDNPALEILGEKVAKRRAEKNSYSTRWLTPADIKKLQAKGYDGIIWKYGKSPIEASAWNANQIKLTSNTEPTLNDDIRYSSKVGYHAGDLGKSESLGNQTGGRDTGHFGTGTYFVGDKSELQYGSYKERPIYEVDFSKYNLWEPLYEEEGLDIHRFLKGVNRYATAPADEILGERAWERLYDEVDNALYEGKYDAKDIYNKIVRLFGVYTTARKMGDVLHYGYATDGTLFDENDKEVSLEDALSKIDMNDLFSSFDRYDVRRATDYAEAYADWWRSFFRAHLAFNKSEEELQKIFREVQKEIQEFNGDAYKADSASTRFMKKLGYEGVDVRQFKRLDNTMYGSVIYDLKDEDLQLKQDIGTARFSQKVDTNELELLKQNKMLEKRNEVLKADVKRLTDLLKLQNKITGGMVLDDKKLKTQAEVLLKDVRSNYSLEDTIKGLRDVYEYILSESNGGEINWDVMMGKAYDLASKMLDKQKPYKWVENSYKDIYDTMRKARIKLTDEQKQEAKNAYGKDWYKEYFGSVVIANDGRSLDSYWQEWASQYPWVFDVNTNPNDMATELLRVYDEVKDSMNVIQYFNSHEDKTALAYEIYNKFWNVPTITTLADKYQAQAKKLKFEHRQAIEELRASKKEAIEQVRAQKKEVVKAVREDRDRKIADLKERIKEKESKRKDEAVRRATLNKIYDVSSTLMDWMQKNTAKEHVPDVLKPVVSQLLNSIDYSSKQLLGLRGGENKGLPTKRDVSIRTAIEKIRNIVNKSTTEEGMEELGRYVDFPPSYAEDLDTLYATVNAIALRTGEDNAYIINEMSTEQLAELYHMVKVMKHVVQNLNAKIAGAYGYTIAYEAQRDIQANKEIGAKENNNFVKKFFEWKNTLPVYAFEHLGQGASSMFAEIQDGWDKFAFNIKQVIDFSKETFTGKQVKEWGEHVNTFKVLVEPTMEELKNGGKPHEVDVQMTDTQIMSLYCLSKREHAKTHFAGGGIRVSDIKDGKKELVQVQNVRLSEKELQRIISTLSPEQIAVADKIQDFMNTVCSDWGNEVSMKRYGIKGFTEKNYFPIKVDTNVISKETRDNEKSVYGLLNMSFTKPITPKASAQMEIKDIFDVFTIHASEMAKYNSIALPVLDMVKYYNYKEIDKDQVTTMKGSIEETFGKEAMAYINHFLVDLNGNQESGRNETVLKKLTRGYKTSAVAGNLQVMLLQPIAITRASLKIDEKYIAKGMVSFGKIKHGIEMMQKYSGIAVWKDLSLFDTNVSRGLDSHIKQDATTYDKVIEKSMKGAEWADKITWGAIWNACEAEARDRGFAGEELYTESAKKFRDIIYHTQVVDSTMTRTDMMRSPSLAVQWATSFMSEPSISMNILQDATIKYSQDARRYGKGEAFRRNGKTIAKAVEIYTINVMAESILRGLVGKWRDLDSEENLLEGMWKEFLENINPLANIPLGRDIVSIFSGYSVDRMDMATVQSMYYAYKGWEKVLGGDDVSYKTIYRTMQAMSQATGIPLSSLLREATTIWNNTIAEMYPYLKIK